MMGRRPVSLARVAATIQRGRDLPASAGVLSPAVRAHSAPRTARDCVSGGGSSSCADAQILIYHRCVPTKQSLLILCAPSAILEKNRPIGSRGSVHYGIIDWLRLCKIDHCLRRQGRRMVKVPTWEGRKALNRTRFRECPNTVVKGTTH